ncbi:unnamed protein product [Prorocentrum cordatum]|uniref:Uncharacterized protein n=1 Tax=Prorocentrum cordatum TaxID=2364126 RepID=A0ABN9PGW6_9DINO|nr:unnamed protein product [Polarella glacialis]
MEEDLDAWHGADVLSAALGQAMERQPGAPDLDDCVDLQVYFDGTPRASEAGEAVAFLRARMCEAFEVLGSELARYLWHRDRFVLEVCLGEGPGDEPHLAGHLRTGDGVEDEWFVVHLLQRLTARCPDASCRVVDSDGELLLIEAALAAPRWLTPTNAENRCWLRGGRVHILPKPVPPEPQRLSRQDALRHLRAAGAATAAKEKVQLAIRERLQDFPRRAVELSTHVARAVLPVPVARLLVAFPQLVGLALDHLPTPPAAEMQRLRRQLEGQESEACFDCEGPPAQETTCIGVRFTRCQFARLAGLRCQLPSRFSQKRWRQPRKADVGLKAMQLGATLCAGLEHAYLQGPRSATALLRWPSWAAAAAALPPSLPWSPDPAFARHAAALRPPPGAGSASARRAYLQQSSLDAPMRPELRAWLADADGRLAEAVDLAAHWRDEDDEDAWLRVSPEELEAKMQARQAEFDDWDRRRQKPSDGDQGAATAEPEGPGAGELERELAGMGQQLSRLLERASCVDGLEAARQPGAARPAAAGQEGSGSDSSGAEDCDVLGMEDEPPSEGDEDESEAEPSPEAELRSYMAELDDQLEEVLDGGGGDEGAPAGEGGGLPLTSHHVRVHGAEPLDLDVHAMEHVLASFCAESRLDPGPAGLLLRELGLAAAGGGADVRKAAAGRAAPCPGACELDSMD